MRVVILSPNIKNGILLLLLTAALASCDSKPTPEYHGALYFAQAAYVMRYSLHDGSLSVQGHLGDTTIREVSALGPDHLLIAESALIDNRPVARISWLDRETGEAASLYPGTLARYLPHHDLVVYDDGSSLFAVPQQDGSANQVIWDHTLNEVTRLLDAAPDLLLIEAGPPGGTAIYSWNPRTGERRELAGLTASCRLEGAVWIEPLQRLACKSPSVPLADAGYGLADLDGHVERRLELPEGRQFLALTYIANQQVLLLQETRPGLLGAHDKHAIWVHDPGSGASEQLPGSENLGKTVVYADF